MKQFLHKKLKNGSNRGVDLKSENIFDQRKLFVLKEYPA